MTDGVSCIIRKEDAGSTVGVIQRLFDRPTVGDLTGYGALLSPDVERIGPWGDRLVRRDSVL
jgi:hypothetical protein